MKEISKGTAFEQIMDEMTRAYCTALNAHVVSQKELDKLLPRLFENCTGITRIPSFNVQVQVGA